MKNENLQQWAARQMAERVELQRPRAQLNRKSLIQAEQSRRAEQDAHRAHQQLMAQRDAAQAARVQPATNPSLAGGLMARVAGIVLPKLAQPETIVHPASRRNGPRPS